MRVARSQLLGEMHEPDREDIVSKSLQEFIKGLIADEESYNQLRTVDDGLGRMRQIVRYRIIDQLRKMGRNREDAVEEPPEFKPDTVPDPRFRLDEIWPEIERLEPNPPVPQVFRDRFIEGYTPAEIAKRRSLNEDTLNSYFMKAFRTLRERLTRLEGPRP